MLQITIPATEQWNENTQEFINTDKQILQLEHSLVSLSKWESKWNKAFLTNKSKTDEETIDYIKCMTLTPNVSSEVYNCLTNNNIIEINNYIKAPMTATSFSRIGQKPIRNDIITSELIYYWMISLNIPFECQFWHLNRLMTLIEVCSIKNQPPKKMSKRSIMSRNASLNAARRRQLNTKG